MDDITISTKRHLDDRISLYRFASSQLKVGNQFGYKSLYPLLCKKGSERWRCEGGKNRDDRHRDQQLDERKTFRS